MGLISRVSSRTYREINFKMRHSIKMVFFLFALCYSLLAITANARSLKLVVKTANYEDCRTVCELVPECKIWVWGKVNKLCHMKEYSGLDKVKTNDHVCGDKKGLFVWDNRNCASGDIYHND